MSQVVRFPDGEPAAGAYGPHPSKRLPGGHAGRAPGRPGPERLRSLASRVWPETAGGQNRPKDQNASLGLEASRTLEGPGPVTRTRPNSRTTICTDHKA